jgi:hypothetical protein
MSNEAVMKEFLRVRQEKLDLIRDEKSKERQEDLLKNPRYGMWDLWRMMFTSNVTFYFRPMHDFDLAWELLVHIKDPITKQIIHEFCLKSLDINNPCQHCDNGDEPKWVFALIGLNYNSLGVPVEFPDRQTGRPVKILRNPVQVVEIAGDGTGGKNVIPFFTSMNKLKVFATSIFKILRVGEAGGGFRQPTPVSPDDLANEIGREGFTADLPEFAQSWIDKVADMAKTSKAKAKDEVLRYILTAFTNGEEVAKIKKLEIPRKPVKQEETQKKSEDQLVN